MFEEVSQGNSAVFVAHILHRHLHHLLARLNTQTLVKLLQSFFVNGPHLLPIGQVEGVLKLLLLPLINFM